MDTTARIVSKKTYRPANNQDNDNDIKEVSQKRRSLNVSCKSDALSMRVHNFTNIFHQMHLNRVLITIIFFSMLCRSSAQQKKEFQLLRFTSSHTSFPDTGRANGYMYDQILYTTAAHYSDSNVLLIIPRHLNAAARIDLIFWFHGWHNNIDTAADFYGLTRQMISSHRNAVLVLAETAKNAPDSYGGKLEQPGVFRSLVQDVIQALKKNSIVPDTTEPGNILLAGHSGAFRVIAYILKNGEMQVQEVYLFDALYSQIDKFMSWISENQQHHFIHWFTNHGGGTDEMSDSMMLKLKNLQIDYRLCEENQINPDILKNNRILFVHSSREHNVIINNPDNFQLILENSFTLRSISK